MAIVAFAMSQTPHRCRVGTVDPVGMAYVALMLDEDPAGWRCREEVLARAKPLPPYRDMIIEGLTDKEEEAFLRAIAEA